MPTELEDLVEFLHHGNTPIRQTAVQTLLPFAKTQPSIFKANQLAAVKDLKLLIKDYPPIAKNALKILINISHDKEVLENLATDDGFLESILARIMNPKEANANELAMLLANMAKSDSLSRLQTLLRLPALGLSTSKLALDQLLDLFVKGAHGSYNPQADFDYLAYVFGDLARHPEIALYLTTPQTYDSLHPLSKLLPFTASPSAPRRYGTAASLKNTAFLLSLHPKLLSPPLNTLPYILIPLQAGTDEYTESETEQMLEELQYPESDQKREGDVETLKTWLEVLLVLGGTRGAREAMRISGAYFVVRECHLEVEDEGVREACERLVQVLMRDEEDEEGEGEGREGDEDTGRGKGVEGKAGRGIKALGRERREGKEEVGRMVMQAASDDEDERVVQIF